MTFLYGTLIAGSASLLMILAGYAVAGLLSAETALTRMALASLLGLAWVVFGASVLGALTSLGGVLVWLIWTPAVLAMLIPATRRQFCADLHQLSISPSCAPAAAGLALLWLALLLPFLVYPDLAFFDGKTNHDNFFWCVGADYLRSHDYLTVAAKNRDYPLFNIIWSFCGWKPAWARMGAEGFIAVMSTTFARTPVTVYNFLVSALALPWLLTTLTIARRMGMPALNRPWLALVCFCQPIFLFFVANGNLPNLLGALFGGGLWLLILLVSEARTRPWPLAAAGIFFMHGILASYPEILLFALAPVGLFAVRHFFAGTSDRNKPLLWIVAVLAGGLCVNPVTTTRLWSGVLNSIGQVQHDDGWANIFGRITFAGYVPSLVTLALPSIRIYGIVGGLVASLAVLVSAFLLFRHSARRDVLLLSLSGFFALLAYTIVRSFGYGWQKSAQFSGIPLAVMFPVLVAGIAQISLRSSPVRRLPLCALLATLGIMIHGMIGTAAENLKSAGNKGLTGAALSLRERVSVEIPGQPIYVDGATFRAAFFQSMWSAELFPKNPLVYLSRQEQAGGYLRDSVNLDNPTTPAITGLYYVATNWAQAFDFDPTPVTVDRVGVLLKQHNLITEFSGFYRSSGLPELTNAEFGLTVYPYAAGWLEFILEPNGPAAPDSQLKGTVKTPTDTQSFQANLDAAHHLVVRFPLQANTRNAISVTISGGPTLDPNGDDPPYPFRIVSVKSGRNP